MFRSRRMRRGRPLAFVAVCAVAATAAVSIGSTAIAEEHVLELIPGDALGFTVVKGVDNLDAKVNAFAKAAGLPIPPVSQSLGKFLKIDGGVKMQSPAAAVVMEGATTDKPAIFLLIPTSDIDALTANWEPKKRDDGMWAVQFGPLPSLCAEKNGYAVLGDVDEEAAMKRLLASETNMVEETTPWHEWGAEQDVVAFVSKAGWKRAYREIGELMDKGIEAIPDDSPQGKQTRAGLDVYRTLFKGLGAEVECFAVGVTIDKDAVLTMTNKAKLVEGGTMEASMKRMPQSPENLLVGLSNEPFFFAGAGGIDKGVMEEMMKFSFAMMKGMPGMMGGTDEQNRRLMEMSMKTVKDITGMGMVFGLPREGDLFLGGMAGVVWTKDAEAYMATYTEQVKEMAELAKEVPQAAWFKDLKLEETDIDGVSGWKIAIDLSAMFEMMKDEPQAAEMLKRMYGESGVITSYFAMAGKEYLVYAYSPETLKKALAAVEDAKNSLAASEEVTQVNGKLMKNPAWVGYISPPGMIAMVNSVMKSTGQPIRLPEFPPTPPIGFAAKYDDGMFTKQLVVLPKTVKNTVFYGLMLQANPPKPGTVE